MISSTSTTSTSGVMLISDCRLEPEAFLFDRNHDLPDLAEIELCIAPDHDLGVRLGAHRSAKSFAKMLGCDRLIVDPQPARLVYGDQDSAPLVALRVRFRGVRQVDVGSLPHLWRHHHEDDQQHQHYVDERRDVDGRLHSGWLTESHMPGLPF